MESTRQHKISRLIQQDLGDILLKEMKPTLGNSLITVTSVRITPDLSIARVHISVMPIGMLPAPEGEEPVAATKDNVMQAIADSGAELRYKLGLREGKQLRIIPTLEFYLDDSLDYIQRIEELLKK